MTNEVLPVGDRTSERRARLSYWRDVTAFVRDLLIGLLVLVCIAQPQIVRSWLSALGVSKATLFGFELTPGRADELARTISRLKQERDSAVSERTELARRAEEALRNLNALRGGDPGIQRSLAQVQQVVMSANEQTSSAPSAQQQIIESARQSLGSEARWAVVFGGDLNVRDAQDELRWAEQNGLEDSELILRQGWYRSVAMAPSLQAAQEALATAKRRRPDSYIVNMKSWCPRRTEREAYTECSTFG